MVDPGEVFCIGCIAIAIGVLVWYPDEPSSGPTPPEGFELECVADPDTDMICFAYCGPEGADVDGFEEPK